MISIDLFSDPICPWCFIGKRRIEAALEMRPDISVEISWHSFQLNPMMPIEGMERDEYLTLKFGNPKNAERLYENIVAMGEQSGIQFDFERINFTPNTVDAHRLIRYAVKPELQEQIVERLFNAYFLEGRNIGDIDCLVDIATTTGMRSEDVASYLESDEDVDVIKNEDMHARQLGIQGVPFYILERQYAISGAQEPEAFHPLFDLLMARQRAVTDTEISRN